MASEGSQFTLGRGRAHFRGDWGVRGEPAGPPSDARRGPFALDEWTHRLDPRRFPGNPQSIEALQLAVLPKLEQSEWRLRQQLGESGQSVRGVNLARIPPGHEKAAAEYYQ